MKIYDQFACIDFPCEDVTTAGYLLPDVEVDPDKVRLVLISETVPADPNDDYYAPNPEALYQRTTLQAFATAGVQAASTQALLDRGIYLTSAVKCPKQGYTLKAGTIQHCTRLLEAELGLFPNIAAYLLMGDAAIKALNTIAKRQGEPAVIPAGATYKIRGQAYTFKGVPAFPSYLQAGPSYGIEKSKVRMIAEDIRAAMALIG